MNYIPKPVYGIAENLSAKGKVKVVAVICVIEYRSIYIFRAYIDKIQVLRCFESWDNK